MPKIGTPSTGTPGSDESEDDAPGVHYIRTDRAEVLADAEKNAKRALWVIWVIFIAALAAGLWMRGQRTSQASEAIADLAMTVSVEIGKATPATVVEKTATELFAEGGKVNEAGVGVKGFKALVRVLAYHQANELGSEPGSAVEPKQAVAAEKAAAEAEKAAIAAEMDATEAEKKAVQAGATNSGANKKAAEAKKKAAEEKREAAEEKKTAAKEMREAVEQKRQKILDETNNLLFTNLVILSLIHAGILSIFPALFTIGVVQGRRHIGDFTRVLESTRDRTFWNAVWWRRHSQFLGEEASPYLGRRVGFAVLISLSILYILAPAGLMASAIGEYTSLRAIPGAPSQPFFFKEFAQVSPFVLGLAGFLLYSLIVFARRAVSYDITNRLFLSLWHRGLTVVILSLVLTAINPESATSNAVIFVAGVFPSTGLQAIAKIAQSGADKLTSLETKGFEDMPEIDPFKEGSLREIGIFSIADLARSNLAEYLIATSRIDPRTLMKAVDRALLIEQLGGLDGKLVKIPAFTASELLLYARGPDAYAARWEGLQSGPPKQLTGPIGAADKKARLTKINEVLEADDATIHLDKLEANQNLMFIIDNQVYYDDV